jgi:hypothetical protein
MLEGLSAPVIGPSTILPRGYLWLAPIWYSAAAVVLVAGHWPPLWFRLSAAAGLLGAMLTLVLAVSRLTVKAFTADSAGVRLGLPSTTRRRGRRRKQARHLTWAQIERVRIARRPYGARLELLLSQDATASARPGDPGVPARIGTWLLLLLIPLWYLRRPTGLASPLDRPPRYRIALANTTTDDLGRAMRALAPADVTVAVLVRKR